MAARDNVLFGASVGSGTAAGTVVPLSLMYGIENVRQGYGAPKLKSVRAYWSNCYNNGNISVPISIKNSNWIDEAGLLAQGFAYDTALNRDSLSFMRGRDKALAPNTSWIINAKLNTNTTAAGQIYVLIEIEYSDVAGINAETAAGSPVMKTCSNASVNGAANTAVSIGTFDNLLQNVTYVMSEVSAEGLSTTGAFVIVEGFSNQKGLIRIIPVKPSGLADQLEGSVYLTKQTYGVSVLSYAALSSASVTVRFEMIASAN